MNVALGAILLAVLSSANTLFAGQTRFCIIPALQLSVPSGDFSGTNTLNEEGGAKTGFGAELSAGFASPYACGYIGFSTVKHEAEGDSRYFHRRVTASGDWLVNRLIVGIRLYMAPPRLPVRPLIGTGLTSGKMRADAIGWAGNDTLSVDEVSENEIGLFGEIGGIYRMSRVADLLVTAQFHRFSASFDSEIWAGTIHVEYMRYSLGLVYRL